MGNYHNIVSLNHDIHSLQKTSSKKAIGDTHGTTKKLCDKDVFAERSGELSGAICLKTLVLLGNDW